MRLARRLLVLFTTAVLLMATVVFVSYRRQIVSYATHWKGSPRSTVAFTSLPDDPGPLLHLALAGDIGDSGSRLDATAAAMVRADDIDHYDALWLLGDNVYPRGDPAKLPETVFTPFRTLLERGTTLLAILGNHDVMAGHGDAQIAALGMDGRWWSREEDGVLLVGLDSNEPDNPEQLAWLEQTLAASTAWWKIVALHHPPYSAGYQGSSMAARKAFSPLFERYGVQLVVSGHDHDYQRSKPINGVTYLVTGGASGTRRTSDRSFTAASFSWHHFTDVAVFTDRIQIRAVNQDLRVADTAVIPLTPVRA